MFWYVISVNWASRFNKFIGKTKTQAFINIMNQSNKGFSLDIWQNIWIKWTCLNGYAQEFWFD